MLHRDSPWCVLSEDYIQMPNASRFVRLGSLVPYLAVMVMSHLLEMVSSFS